MVLSKTIAQKKVITLLPNRSATWQETRLFLYLLCGTTLAIGVFWAFVGVWAVLPFSGLEAALLAGIMYRVSMSTYQRQVITFSDQEILVQFGRKSPGRSWRLDPRHTRLSVTEPDHHLDSVSLSLFDSNLSIEVGEFLNQEDKQLALSEFRQAGLNIRSHNRPCQKAF